MHLLLSHLLPPKRLLVSQDHTTTNLGRSFSINFCPGTNLLCQLASAWGASPPPAASCPDTDLTEIIREQVGKVQKPWGLGPDRPGFKNQHLLGIWLQSGHRASLSLRFPASSVSLLCRAVVGSGLDCLPPWGSPFCRGPDGTDRSSLWLRCNLLPVHSARVGPDVVFCTGGKKGSLSLPLSESTWDWTVLIPQWPFPWLSCPWDGQVPCLMASLQNLYIFPNSTLSALRGSDW